MARGDLRAGVALSVGKGPLPPTIFLVALLLQIGLQMAWPLARIDPLPWSSLGGVLLLVGLLVTVLADRQFKQARTAIHPFYPPSVLVTEGVFRVSRNPMYLGLAAALSGTALLLGTVTPLLIPPLFVALISMRFIRHEERVLAQRFGERYSAYAQRTRRWL